MPPRYRRQDPGIMPTDRGHSLSFSLATKPSTTETKPCSIEHNPQTLDSDHWSLHLSRPSLPKTTTDPTLLTTASEPFPASRLQPCSIPRLMPYPNSASINLSSYLQCPSPRPPHSSSFNWVCHSFLHFSGDNSTFVSTRISFSSCSSLESCW